MNILELTHRKPPVIDLENWQKIPWEDPEISPEILAEHLAQDHDYASRRREKIDAHTRWIHRFLLDGQPSRILDLGCGPGLYTQRLTEMGHVCTGIDFAPASIAYAREQALQAKKDIRYEQGDIRTVDFGGEYDLIMLIFGEFNVFSPATARRLLEKMHTALAPEGLLLLEIYSLDGVRNLGEQPRYWETNASGIFCREPHLYLEENGWNAEHSIAVTTYFIFPAGDAPARTYHQYVRGYTHGEYEALLADAGFADFSFFPLFGGAVDTFSDDMIVLTARKS